MGILEQQAQKFWTLMQNFKHGPNPLSKSYAKEIELPTLAAQTDWERLQQRIEKEISQ